MNVLQLAFVLVCEGGWGIIHGSRFLDSELLIDRTKNKKRIREGARYIHSFSMNDDAV